LRDDTPEAYFSKLQKVIEGKTRWRVRRFVVVGHFAFARLVIYNDLDPQLWPGEVGIVGNSNILELFAGGDKGDKQESFSAEEYEVDNPTVASKVPLLITDADAATMQSSNGGNASMASRWLTLDIFRTIAAST
jgi:hypothetical protein